MNFGHTAEEEIIDLINEPFQNVHMAIEFMQLSQRLQILIARKLLWKVYKENIDADKGVLVLSSVIDHALLLIFDHHQQKHLLQAHDRDHLDSVIEKQVSKRPRLDYNGIDS